MIRTKISMVCVALIFAAATFAAADDLSATVVKITGKADHLKGRRLGRTGPRTGAAHRRHRLHGLPLRAPAQIGPSTVTVKALSRLTVKDLALTGTAAKTDLYLAVGKIDAEVNKSEAVTEQKFTVGSPVSTASVRGTSFSFDGINLRVGRGIVDFSDLRGNVVRVPVGEPQGRSSRRARRKSPRRAR